MTRKSIKVTAEYRRGSGGPHHEMGTLRFVNGEFHSFAPWSGSGTFAAACREFTQTEAVCPDCLEQRYEGWDCGCEMDRAYDRMAAAATR